MDFTRFVDRLNQSPLGRFVQKYFRDEAPMYATLIAFNAILSMFPIMLALLAIIGLFVRDERALQAINEAIVRILPGDVEGDALRVVQSSRTGSGLFGLIGFLGLLWGGSALFGVMASAFNRAFGVQDRDFVKKRLMAFTMIFVFAFLLLLATLATSLAAILLSFSRSAIPFEFIQVGWLDTISAWLTSLVSSFLLFLIIYWIVPNRSFRFGNVWPGALLAAILFFVIVQAWPIYLAYFGRFNRFGALFGLFLLVMTWFYFLGNIVMVGAELNAFLLEKRTDPRSTPSSH